MTVRCAQYMSALKIVCKRKIRRRLRKNLHIIACASREPRKIRVLHRNALEILEGGVWGFMGRGWTCTVVFLGGHFLFSCSDTFAVGCIV